MSTTVLVVEDDLEINELLGEYLALENIKYLQATTGQAGIHLATANHPDALILDLMLPDIDGFEVARALSTHRATFDIPIIILSCMCQECDREKGFASGALFFMNKPFLPDDLLTTLRRALEWKLTLHTRPPAGEILLGDGEPELCSQTTNQMIADVYARTDLPDTAVGDIHDAVATLGKWASQWNGEHAQHSRLKLEYQVQAPGTSAGLGGNGSPSSRTAIEWKMTEDVPGILADAFFRGSPGAEGNGAPINGGNGWNASNGAASRGLQPIAPPSKWLQLLAKTGAARFEKDSRTRAVRFSRFAGNLGPLTAANASIVPVVDIDGTRYPTRLRDEALAAKRK